MQVLNTSDAVARRMKLSRPSGILGTETDSTLIDFRSMFWIDGGPVFVLVSCNLFQRQYTRILTDTDRLTHRQTHKQLDIPRQRHRRTERHTQPDTDTGRHRQTHTEPHTLPHIQSRRACRNQFSMCSYLIVMIAMAGLKARPQDSNVLSCRYCLTQLKFQLGRVLISRETFSLALALPN